MEPGIHFSSDNSSAILGYGLGFVLYFLCLIGVVILGVRYVYRKNNQKLIRLKEQQAAQQKEELNQLKFRFLLTSAMSFELRLL